MSVNLAKPSAYETTISNQLVDHLNRNDFWNLRMKLDLLNDNGNSRDQTIYNNFVETYGKDFWEYTKP